MRRGPVGAAAEWGRGAPTAHLGERGVRGVVWGTAGRPEPQALLVDLSRVHRHPRVLGPDVEPVGPRGGEGDPRPSVEDRREHGHVVEVGAGDVWVVQDPDVALAPDLGPEASLGGSGARLQVAEEERDPKRLAEDAVAGVD